MARSGITLLDVEQAALKLQGRGKTPTADGIREVLGTGSKSTITQHLRTWKAQQPNHQPLSSLPQELLTLVAGLWERLNARAEENIDEANRTAEEQIKGYSQKTTAAYQTIAALQQQLHQAEETLSVERAAKQQLEKDYQHEQQEHTKIRERHQALSEQLDYQKGENTRLHQLATNMQHNLEHYQNAIQQQQTEHILLIDKQQTQFKQEIAELQRELALKNNRINELEQECHQLALESHQARGQSQVLKKDYDQLTQQHNEQIHALTILQERYTQQHQTLQIAQANLDEKQLKLAELEKEFAVTIDQRNQLQKSLISAEDKIEVLRNEKLFLAQEKAQLEGALKHFEKIKSK